MRASIWLGAFLITIVAAPLFAQDAPPREGDRETPPKTNVPEAESAPPEPPSPEPPLPEPPSPEPPSPEPPPAVTARPAPTVTVDSPPTATPDVSTELDLRILFGGIALGVGAAAVVAGSVVGIIAAARYADLECPNDSCPPELADDGSAYNDLRIPSGVTIFSGSVLALTGLVFLINGLTDDDEPVVVEISPQSVALRGRF